ncbi:putative metallothionein-i transcription activator [Diplogelasinospora grovesii]|uniref:Metallothionein-i transcription activator n=1 Tax=Diplogelasinospora grovesii TaxID=303347 RepID=A0AAN6S5E7_9PEZI|nr:putative metallothionein-i transcription activator [Diplogelasinospora grovesii]
MSQEQYKVPTASPSQQVSSSQAKEPDRSQNATGTQLESDHRCGDCAAIVHLTPRGPIRCTKCGCRIVHKMRTKRMMQFEAR